MKTRPQLDTELAALAAAAPYLQSLAPTAEEFHLQLETFIDEIKAQTSASDASYVELRAREILRLDRH